MGQYTSSKGIVWDTVDMPQKYLENALNKAEENLDQDVVDILQAEITLRENNNGTMI